MARDHKFSGTLPLLAYAPEDFGVRAQRSRAYRAQAAMGRTSVQSLRNHAQASVAVKPVVLEPASEPQGSAFIRLLSRAGSLFRRSQNKAQPAQVVASVVTEKVVIQPVQTEHDSVAKPATIDVARAIKGVNTEQTVAASQPVSSSYAAMRLGTAAATSEPQSIPEAPDIAHALVEIREALREHERLARAKLGGDNSA